MNQFPGAVGCRVYCCLIESLHQGTNIPHDDLLRGVDNPWMEGNYSVRPSVVPISKEYASEPSVNPLLSVADILVMNREVIAANGISTLTVAFVNEISAPETDPEVSLKDTSKIQYADKNTGQFDLNPHGLRLLDLKDAVDLWPKVLADKWHCAQ